MKVIHTDQAPEPAGHYSQGIVHGGVIYVSGMLPVRPSGEKVTGSIEEQTSQALDNMEAVLKAAGSNRERVLKTTIYVADISLWDRVNTVYAEFFGSHRPARAVVPSRELHFGFLVEVEAVALL